MCWSAVIFCFYRPAESRPKCESTPELELFNRNYNCLNKVPPLFLFSAFKFPFSLIFFVPFSLSLFRSYLLKECWDIFISVLWIRIRIDFCSPVSEATGWGNRCVVSWSFFSTVVSVRRLKGSYGGDWACNAYRKRCSFLESLLPSYPLPANTGRAVTTYTEREILRQRKGWSHMWGGGESNANSPHCPLYCSIIVRYHN